MGYPPHSAYLLCTSLLTGCPLKRTSARQTSQFPPNWHTFSLPPGCRHLTASPGKPTACVGSTPCTASPSSHFTHTTLHPMGAEDPGIRLSRLASRRRHPGRSEKHTSEPQPPM